MFIFSIYLEKVRDIKLTTLNIATIKNKNFQVAVGGEKAYLIVNKLVEFYFNLLYKINY